MKKLQDDDDEMYYNTNGLVVFTEAFLLQRGYCCGNGCRHCPFDFKAVPEPRKSRLLAERKSPQSGENKNDFL